LLVERRPKPGRRRRSVLTLNSREACWSKCLTYYQISCILIYGRSGPQTLQSRRSYRITVRRWTSHSSPISAFIIVLPQPGSESAKTQLLSVFRVALLGLPENSAFIIVLRNLVPNQKTQLFSLFWIAPRRLRCAASLSLFRKLSFYHCFSNAVQFAIFILQFPPFSTLVYPYLLLSTLFYFILLPAGSGAVPCARLP